MSIIISGMFRDYMKLLQERKSADDSIHLRFELRRKGKVLEKTYVIANTSETRDYETRKLF